MPWWTLRYYKTGTVYNSEQLPFGLLPGIQEVNLEIGHKFEKSDMVFEISERIRIEVHSGSIWVDGRLVGAVPDAERIILRKRHFRSSKGGSNYYHIHAGLVDENGKGCLVCLTHTGEILIDNCVVSTKQNGSMVR